MLLLDNIRQKLRNDNIENIQEILENIIEEVSAKELL